MAIWRYGDMAIWRYSDMEILGRRWVRSALDPDLGGNSWCWLRVLVLRRNVRREKVSRAASRATFITIVRLTPYLAARRATPRRVRFPLPTPNIRRSRQNWYVESLTRQIAIANTLQIARAVCLHIFNFFFSRSLISLSLYSYNFSYSYSYSYAAIYVRVCLVVRKRIISNQPKCISLFVFSSFSA